MKHIIEELENLWNDMILGKITIENLSSANYSFENIINNLKKIEKKYNNMNGFEQQKYEKLKNLLNKKNEECTAHEETIRRLVAIIEKLI